MKRNVKIAIAGAAVLLGVAFAANYLVAKKAEKQFKEELAGHGAQYESVSCSFGECVAKNVSKPGLLEMKELIVKSEHGGTRYIFSDISVPSQIKPVYGRVDFEMFVLPKNDQQYHVEAQIHSNPLDLKFSSESSFKQIKNQKIFFTPNGKYSETEPQQGEPLMEMSLQTPNQIVPEYTEFELILKNFPDAAYKTYLSKTPEEIAMFNASFLGTSQSTPVSKGYFIEAIQGELSKATLDQDQEFNRDFAKFVMNAMKGKTMKFFVELKNKTGITLEAIKSLGNQIGFISPETALSENFDVKTGAEEVK